MQKPDTQSPTLRVAHYRSAFTRLSEVFIYDAIAEQDRQGIDCTVLTRDRITQTGRPFDRVETIPLPRRLEPRRIAQGVAVRLLGRRSNRILLPLGEKGLRERLVALSPDILHAHFGDDAVFAAGSASGLGIPLVATFYGHDVSRLPAHPFWTRRYRRLWPRLGAAVALSEDMRDELISIGCPAHKTHVVHLAKHLSEHPFEPSARPVRTFVSIGRLSPKKGHDDTIRAIMKARSEGLDVRLRVIGGGVQEDYLRGLCREIGTGDAVQIMGALPHDVAMEELARADAFILSSKIAPDGDKEGTPTAIAEAQARGMPVVSTLHAGIPEMIPEEGQQLLAPEGDVAALSECITRLCSMNEEAKAALTAAGRQHVELHFNVQREAEKLVKLVYLPLLPPSHAAHARQADRTDGGSSASDQLR